MEGRAGVVPKDRHGVGPQFELPSSSVSGYRFWVIDRAHDPSGALLRSPYNLWFGTVWSSAEHQAVCAYNPAHRPPHQGCLCGVAALRTSADLWGYIGRYRRWQVWRPGRFDTEPLIVMGCVVLEGAVGWRFELLAAAAKIKQLLVLADDAYGADRASALRESLMARYAVPCGVYDAPW